MTANVEAYLGSGPNHSWHVPDLVSGRPSRTRLLLVLESPHIEEIAVHRPVVGSAGRSALRFLLGTRSDGASLGDFIADKHAHGDDRVGIMNVSMVPLQKGAFRQQELVPELSTSDWHWLGETFRNSKAASVNRTTSASSNVAGQLLLNRLQVRIDRQQLMAGCVVVACGRFAKRYVRQLSRLPGPRLEVDHPSNNLWRHEPTPSELERLRSLFGETTS